ncbi:hypothetical protein U0070_013812, partial [Myodes glareolus]
QSKEVFLIASTQPDFRRRKHPLTSKNPVPVLRTTFQTGYAMLERERGQQEPDMVTWMMQFACAMNRSAPLQKVWHFRLQKELHSESTLGEQTLRPVVVDFLDFEIVIQFWEAKSMRGTCPRRKISKEPLSALICANADGAHKLKSVIIGKAKMPKRVEEDTSTVSMIYKPIHPSAEALVNEGGQAKYKFFTCNTSILIQPMNQDIILSYKQLHRWKQLEESCNFGI